MKKKGKFKTKARDLLSHSRPENLSDFLSPEEPKYQPNRIYQININNISPNPNQPRKYFDPKGIKELAESIKQKGIIQPIVLRIAREGQLILVAGERRLKAAKIAGFNVISAIFTTGNPLEISLIENLQRENLKPLEEAEALQKMIEDHHYTQEKLALVIGKARSTLSEILSINRLPAEIKQELRHSDLPKRALIELAKQDSKSNVLKLFNRIRKESLNSDQVRSITRKKRRFNPADHLLNKISEFKMILTKLETEKLSPVQNAQLIENLKEINDLLNEFLS